MPPNVSQGEPACSPCSGRFAWSVLTGVGLLTPSMNTRPERSLAPGFPLKSQVAYAVVIEPPSEWPPRTTLPPCFLGVVDDAAHVLDLGVHALVAREPDVGVGDELEVLGDAGVGDEPEVVVEQLLRGVLSLLGLVEHGVVLEDVLAALDRPYLPALRFADDVLGQRFEVRRARQGSGHQHEDVLGVAGAGLDDPDLLVLRRRPGRVEALDPLELHV